ncbi:restriction endonuclease subunit S [Helicobacter pylori]|uniref:Restriction endonuclease subunit S n=1 Tax=Helicobacter pylori TaxID=210 RepID=A0ABD7CDT9_HELPX|nr:restriction endonuclease subunit S [Helicobacter pylori]QQX00064.1 restriction endonuclease subunit S [Helicobacter pylori]
MIGPLSSQLNAIKWGEFKLGDLFEIEKTLSFNKDALTQGQEYDYITRTSQNQGVLQTTGFVNAENLNPPFTWSLGLLQMDFFYRKKSWYAGQFMRKITPKTEIENKINSRIAHYFTTLLNALKRPLLSVLVRDIDKTFREQKIQLPLKPSTNTQTLDDIDFHFMEKFIAELEQCRLAELEAYLKATGLSNTTLSNDEQNALNLFKCDLTWQSFKLGDLFEIEKTLSFNKDALTQGQEYDYITRTSQNQGVLQTTGFVNAENLNPPFTWSLGLLQMDFFYRKKSWYAGQFMRKITPKTEIENKINSRIAHYFTTLLNALKRPLLSVLVRDIDKTFREQKIQLPLKPSTNTQTLKDIDFHFMRTFINALMKQTIQGVVQYSSAKIQATKEAISQETPTQKDSLF